MQIDIRVLVFMALLIPSELLGDVPEAGDFLPINRGGPSVIAEPDAIEIQGDLIRAKTAQDAANQGESENIAALSAQLEKAKTHPEIGARWLEFPSGEGVIATGQAIYTVRPNSNASRIDQRNAYVIAFTNAKAALVRQLGGIDSVGKTVLGSIATQIETDDASRQSSQSSLEERIEQAAELLLRGYVVFSVKEIEDDTDSKVRNVYVTLVSSAKTQQAVVRDGIKQSANSVLAALQSVLDELNNGIVPPVGGRIIVVPETGETAIVAFGSAVVTTTANTQQKYRNQLNAKKISAARARDALVGILDGDSTMWAYGVSSAADKNFEQSTQYAIANDPLAAAKTEVNVSVTAMEEQFAAGQTQREEIFSIRKGRLPPGVQDKSWIDEDGVWAYTMVVYYPNLSKLATDFSKQMSRQTEAASGLRKGNKRLMNLEIKLLPSGTVTPFKDL